MNKTIKWNKDEFFTRKEAAAFLNCSVSKLNKLAMTHPEQLPYCQIGKSSQYRKKDLENYRKIHMRGITNGS